MSTIPAELNAPITDLTADEFGDVNLWLGQGKRYHDVPEYVSRELCHRTTARPTEASLLPSPLLPVLHLIDFPSPPTSQSLQDLKPEQIFSHSIATHPSSECLRLSAPSHDVLNALMDCAGQAMLDGKISMQHWEERGVFLPFDALGLWALIVQVNTAKDVWRDALRWLGQHNVKPTQHIQAAKFLGAIPWNGYIKGLGSGISITEMASFLSRAWLSDIHVDTMLSAAMHLRRDTLSRVVPHTEIILSNFVTHILESPLLEMTPIPCDYLNKAPKSVQKLVSVISESSSGIRIATVSFSHPSHWACLIIDCQAGTISWGDSFGRAAPAGLEKRLKAWLGLFSPQIKFSSLQALPCAHQTNGYSCAIIAVNTLKHNLFGDELWSEQHRESLRIAEFFDILEISGSLGCIADVRTSSLVFLHCTCGLRA